MLDILSDKNLVNAHLTLQIDKIPSTNKKYLIKRCNNQNSS